MVASITLDTDPPALLGHAENESPSLLGIKVSVSQHQEALVLPQLKILFEVFKYLTSMELFNFGVPPDPSLYNSFLFELIE